MEKYQRWCDERRAVFRGQTSGPRARSGRLAYEEMEAWKEKHCLARRMNLSLEVLHI